MPLQHENTWFERSGQMWKLRTMWMLAGVTLLVALFGFSTQWRTHTINIRAMLIALCSGVGTYMVGACVRCRVCGERVVATLYQHESRTRFLTGLRTLEKCPVCGDPGDGSNPKRW